MIVSVGMAEPTSYVDYLNPPSIRSPIYEDAEVVEIAHFTPNAEITIFANNVEEIGKGSFWFGRCTFKVDRKLTENDKITATQTVNGDTSYHTPEPIVVENLPADVLSNEALPRPSIIPPLHDCQRIVPIKDLLEGSKVEVYSDSTLIGRVETASDSARIGTHQLKENDEIRAVQSICGQFFSLPSPGEEVNSRPASLPPPKVRENSIVDGGNTVIVDRLTTGALVEIYSDDVTHIGGGIAPGPNVIFPVKPSLTKDSKITAIQFFCDHEMKSDISLPEFVTDVLDPPTIEKPICEGSIRVTICDTIPGAIIKIFVNGKQAGQFGSTGYCNTPYLGGNIILKDGDEVYATQTIGTVTSKPSETVVVKAFTPDPIFKIENGHPFFLPEGNEQAIPGPVFLRGVLTTSTFGPVFRAIMCCATTAIVDIIDPFGESIETIMLVETKPGYFKGGWDWKHVGWNIPDDIPVGGYKARFKITSCGGETLTNEMDFYVIFNPTEVGISVSSAFALHNDRGEKGIFFTPGYGIDYANVFNLHPDDNRIFGPAILEVNGETSAYQASIKIMDWIVPVRDTFDCDSQKPIGNLPPGKNFRYSTCTRVDDSILLLARADKAVQCTDCANLFTAMLRGIGIPSHPVTGDADAEHGAIDWGYDTWAEARLIGPLGEEWYVFHPHDPPNGYGPVLRPIAGDHKWMNKNVNEINIMANENWDEKELNGVSDEEEFGYVIAFSYKDCGVPNQIFDEKAAWVEHLCLSGSSGSGYWNKGHWICPPSHSPDIMFSLDKEQYNVNDTMHIIITIRNPTEDHISSDLNVGIVLDNPQTKLFPDEILKEISEFITVEPGDSKSIEMKYKIPLTLSSYNTYIIRAIFAEEYETIPFEVYPFFESALVLPDYVEEEEEFETKLTIFNPQETTLEDIHVSLSLPFEVQSVDETLERYIEEIEPQAKQTLIWNLSAISHSVVAPFELTISCENGGGEKIFKGVEILQTYFEDLEVTSFRLTAILSASKINITLGETIEFNAYAPKGGDLVYYFDFGDNTPIDMGYDAVRNYTYSKKGIYIVKLKVKDAYGEESLWDSIEITVNEKIPGFEFILLVGAVALILILERKKITKT